MALRAVRCLCPYTGAPLPGGYAAVLEEGRKLTSAGTCMARRNKSTETAPRPDFGDSREAYRSKSFSELLRHYIVFKVFTFKPLVDNNKTVSLSCHHSLLHLD